MVGFVRMAADQVKFCSDKGTDYVVSGVVGG